MEDIQSLQRNARKLSVLEFSREAPMWNCWKAASSESSRSFSLNENKTSRSANFSQISIVLQAADLRGNITFLPPCSSQERLQMSEGSFPNRWSNDSHSAVSSGWNQLCSKFKAQFLIYEHFNWWLISYSENNSFSFFTFKTKSQRTKYPRSLHPQISPLVLLWASNLSILPAICPSSSAHHPNLKKKMQTVLACLSLCFWEFISKHFSTDKNWHHFIGLLCKSGLCGCYHLGWAVCIYWLWSLRNSCKDKTIPKVLDCIYSTNLFIFMEVFCLSVFSWVKIFSREAFSTGVSLL